ncbi:FSH1-domain-containing protein [Phlegmacium glaucopus]|nr:FSH1-domain-containing protein [Phlegmacium glaucopus]
MKRVLVLHGYAQNAVIFSKRVSAIRKECKNNVDFVFVNAPHILLPSEVHSRFDSEPQLEAAAEEAPDLNLALRGWWRSNEARTKADGLQTSILAIRDLLVTQRFNGVLGFSQGGAFAAVIAALLERPHLYPEFLVDGKSPHPPLQFCISVSGFRLNDPFSLEFLEPNYSTPTLHILGKTDVVVVEERSRQLIEVSKNSRVEEHNGGHFVPSQGSWRKFLANYMSDPSEPHPSPSVGAVNSESDASRQAGSYRAAVMTNL